MSISAFLPILAAVFVLQLNPVLSISMSGISYSSNSQINPDEQKLANTYYLKGLDHHYDGEHEDAIDAFNRAFELQDPTADQIAYRARSYLYLDRYAESLVDFEKALKLSGLEALYLPDIANLLVRNNQLQDALDAYNRLIMLSLNEPAHYASRGNLLLKMDDFSGAEANYNLFINLRPDSAWGYDLKIKLYKQTDQMDQAITTIEELLEKHAEDPMLYFKRGQLRETENQTEQAIADYEFALAHKGDRGVILPQLANLLFRLGEYEDAISLYNEIADIRPNDAYYHNREADTYIQLGDHSRALQSFQTAAAVDSTNIYAFSHIGDLEFKSGNFEDSLAAYEQILVINNNSVIHTESYIKVLLALNRKEEALDTFTQLSSRVPANQHYLGEQVRLLQELGRHNEAVALINQLLENQGNKKELLPQLLTSAFLSQQYAIAHQSYHALAELDPELLTPRRCHADWLSAFVSEGTDIDQLNHFLEHGTNQEKKDFLPILAFNFNKAGRHIEAVKSYNQLIELAPSQYEYREIRGKSLIALNHYEDALRDFKFLNENSSENHNYQYLDYIADLQFKIGQPYEALSTYEELVTAYPQEVMHKTSLIKVLVDLRRYRRAWQEIQPLIGVEKDQVYVQADLISLIIKIEKSAEALPLLTAAIAERPESQWLYSARANLYIDLENHEKAHADFDQAITLQPDHHHFYWQKRNLLIQEGKFDEVLLLLNQFLMGTGDEQLFLIVRARHYLENMQEYEKALEDYNQLLEDDPLNVVHHVDRARVYAALGLDNLMLQGFEEAVNINPDSPYIYHHRRIYYEQQGDYAAAMNNQNKIVLLSPNNPHDLYTRAKVHRRADDMNGALADYRELRTRFPKYSKENRVGLEMLGMVVESFFTGWFR